MTPSDRERLREAGWVEQECGCWLLRGEGYLHSPREALAKLNRSTGQTEEEASDGRDERLAVAGDNDSHRDGRILSGGNRNDTNPQAPLTSQSVSAPESAEQFWQKWADLTFGEYVGRTKPDDITIQFAEAYAREYASSSNAASEQILADARLIADGEKLWKGVKWVDMRNRAEAAEQSRDTWKDCAEKTAQLVVKAEAERDTLREARDEWKQQSLALVVLLKAKCSDEEWAGMNAKFDAALGDPLKKGTV